MSARAPGRVNLIGEHTDYTGGLALPMAIDLEVRVRLTFDGPSGGDGRFRLTSDRQVGTAEFEATAASLDRSWLAAQQPPWARLAAAILAAADARRSARGGVTSTLPIGAGLGSSAAFEVALALALEVTAEHAELARLCQRAEAVATGVPCGLMDQLTVLAGVEGSALLLDFAGESAEPVALPEQLEVWVVDSGQRRQLASSPYAQRRLELEAAERQVGPLRLASASDLERIGDLVQRRRARHVVTENARVRAAVECLRSGDLVSLGRVLSEGHRSLATDFEASTSRADRLVERLGAQPGVYGARLGGGGFGGCVVAVAERGAFARCLQEGGFPGRAWPVAASRGASIALE